ncbi:MULTISPECIES: hypothetical protein [unclassified Mesorhizobium]|uniref:hypothetical protein n=1 Tax=unclassified Mesorhizobium TaxID=325217 RepID=UPI000FCCA5B2|nr:MULTISPECIES: hypothetical protein [unclassified Mesorhizobium]RUW28665.1 hypothetical protein EOA38_25110 [Mesorhizobium sp. M1E.F.Ca.ET.041.01.1.1]RWD79233.1 MAG: hypothetical protein EOS38_32330 [Mesorhizobium sp.]RWD80987.1 MAG: hypothetical protein EOS39_31355 [Mesorhizobium sp.]TIV45335.1 MAG: hypothetical protein E5V88_33945 [Mesorhizobium sp.]
MTEKKLPHAFDVKPVLDLIAGIEADLQRLKGLVEEQIEKFDPANPHNKTLDGKLTEEGVECCYRMFDEGKSRYSVAQQMKISFAAATHRFNSWRKLGGKKRTRTLLG